MKHSIFMTWLAVLALSMAACSDLGSAMNRENCDPDDEDCIESCYIQKCGIDAAKSLRKDGVRCRSMYWHECVDTESLHGNGSAKYRDCKLGDYNCLDACFRNNCGVLEASNSKWSSCVDRHKDTCESLEFDEDWTDIDWGSGGGWDSDD